MQRVALQTVTDVPVLIPCSEAESEGVAMDTPVRVLTSKMVRSILHASAEKLKQFQMTKAQTHLLLGLKLLLQAKEIGDDSAGGAAVAMLNEASKQATFGAQMLGSHMKSNDPVLLQMVLQLDALGQGSLIQKIINYQTTGARPVGWNQTDKNGDIASAVRFGIYCPDMRTAVFYKSLFNGIRVCLYCHEVFLPNRSGSQMYCSVEHRETHRVRRWREKKREEARQHAKK